MGEERGRRARVPPVIYSLNPSTRVGFLHNDYISRMRCKYRAQDNDELSRHVEFLHLTFS